VSIEWKQLEKKAVELAEKGNLEEALKLFDQAIVLQPEKAAGYNNRAQLWRLKGNLDSKVFSCSLTSIIIIVSATFMAFINIAEIIY